MPDPASALVEAERKAQFEEAGALFESRLYLTFVWLPPAEEASRVEGLLYEGRSKRGVAGTLDEVNRLAFRRRRSPR